MLAGSFIGGSNPVHSIYEGLGTFKFGGKTDPGSGKRGEVASRLRGFRSASEFRTLPRTLAAFLRVTGHVGLLRYAIHPP